MKLYRSLMAVLMLLIAVCVSAVPAKRGLRTFSQPDGSQVSLELVGDEFGHFYQTEDGQMVLKSGEGYYFATLNSDGRLTASNVIAANPGSRNQLQTSFLASVDDEALRSAATKRSVERRNARKVNPSRAKAHEGLFPGTNPAHVGSPHYLIILVEYQDVKFHTTGYATNAKDYFTHMLRQEDFSEYSATGSAYDYFNQASKGQFTPSFDVYGPVTLDYEMAHYGGNDASGNDQAPEQMAIEACQKLDATVNFSQYDTDGDGWIDNVFIFYAGQGEASYGSDDSVWPHAWYVYSGAGEIHRFDGKYLDRYGCTNEWGKDRPDGVGTFVHEFSHVLGLPDLYVTDYNSGARYLTPSAYDVMDYGPYNHDGMTPPTYSLYERNAMSWVEPTVLTAGETRSIQLNSLFSSNEGYIINSPTTSGSSTAEFFLIENRQQEGWDAYIPNHGMLIWHIDYDEDVWNENAPNNSATHQYVDIEEASGIANSGNSYTMKGYTFPGTSNVTSFDRFTNWNGTKLNYPITNIAESNGVISFDVCASGATVEPEGDVYYELVTDASKLEAGKKVIIAVNNNGTWCAMKSNSDSYESITVSADGKTISAPGNAAVYTLVESGVSGYPWSFKDPANSNKYVGNSTKDNKLEFNASNGTGFAAKYDPLQTKNSLVFNGTQNKTNLYFNTSGSLFRIYGNQTASNYLAPKIFMEVTKTTEPETPVVNPPTVSHESGIYNNAFNLTLTKDNDGDDIKYVILYYNDDVAGGTYSAPVTIADHCLVEVWSERGGVLSSRLNFEYDFKAATPTITPETSTLTTLPQETIACETEGASIYYTLGDADFSTSAWTLYSAPFTPEGESPVTVRAIAVKGEWTNSEIASATYTVDTTVPSVEVGTGVYQLVKSVNDLVEDRNVIIVASGYAKALSTTQNNNNRGAADVTKSGDKITPGSDVQILKLEKESGKYMFYTGTAGYLKSESSGNYLRTNTNPGNYGKATIEITTAGVATITFSSGSSKIIKYNPSSTIFSCYSSGQQPVAIYQEIVEMVDPNEPQTVATPAITPESGTYNEMPQVTIACETEGASIYYSLGSEDFSTSAWTLYSAPFTPDAQSPVTVRAIAVKEGMTNSEIASATYTIDATAPSITGEYQLVKSVADLVDGRNVIIVASSSNKAMSTTQNNNNRGAADVTKSEDKITPGTDVQILTLEKEGTQYMFKAGSDGYLCATSDDKNYLHTETNPANRGKASITITAAGEATITFAEGKRTVLKYNSGSDIFSCYASGQDNVGIYQEISAADPEKPKAVATPQITPASDYYTAMPEVTITCETEDASIYYTLGDADFSTDAWTLYSVPFTPEAQSPVTVRAIAVKEGMTNSEIAEVQYEIVDGVMFDFTKDTAYDMTLLSGSTQNYNSDPYVCAEDGATMTLYGNTRWWATNGGNELRFYSGSSFELAADKGSVITKAQLMGVTNSNWTTKDGVCGVADNTWIGDAPKVKFLCGVESKNTAIKKVLVKTRELVAPKFEMSNVEIVFIEDETDENYLKYRLDCSMQHTDHADIKHYRLEAWEIPSYEAATYPKAPATSETLLGSAEVSEGIHSDSFTGSIWLHELPGDEQNHCVVLRAHAVLKDGETKVLSTAYNEAEEGTLPYGYVNIEPLTITGPTSGIDALGVDGQAAVEYYNLQGVRVAADNLTPGFYIRRQGTKASRILVK